MYKEIKSFSLLNNLRQTRETENFKIGVLAERIGISRQALYEIENNKRYPSLLTASKIAWFFDKNLEDVFKFYVEESD